MAEHRPSDQCLLGCIPGGAHDLHCPNRGEPQSSKELVLGFTSKGGISGHEGCAAEICRLQAEIEQLRGPGNPTQMALDAATKPLHVEIERLRAIISNVHGMLFDGADFKRIRVYLQRESLQAANETKPVQGPYVPKTSAESDAALVKAFGLRPEVQK